MLGTAQVDTETNLLALVDSSVVDHETKVNGSIMRRALKSLANDDFRLAAWAKFTTETKQVVDKRFIEDADDNITADGYYTLLCSQFLQKLLRTATQKFKPKEPPKKFEV